MKNKYSIAIAICTFLISVQLQTGLSTAQDSIPETAPGKCLAQLLEVVNGSDEDARLTFLKDGFAKNDEATVKERKMQTDQVISQLGKLTFKKVVESTDREISAVCNASAGPNVILSIVVNDEDKIESVSLEIGGDEEDGEMADVVFDAGVKADVIKRLASELRSKYVYPKVGEEMAALVEKSIGDGEYEEVDNARQFAKELTDQLREICNDKHLRVRAGVPRRAGNSPGRRPVDNHGFVKAEMLPGGVGYLKFNYFSGDIKAQKTAAAAMNFLGNSNALIFDLRENGGGSPEMIAFLTSYLYEEPVHLNSFYNRPTETTTESWTQKDVPGKKFSPDTPVFVLTSKYTFSGAEEFSYNLKNLKRGTIVGETTGGGAHPVMPVTLGKQMHITMPFARAINPITETNWEGVGVKPHFEVASDQALEKALELAQADSTAIASKEAKPMEKTETSNVDIDGLRQKAADLMANQSFESAVFAYGKLTELEPENGNAWFRYGYCLHANGQLDKAIEIHKKAATFDRFAGIATYNLACAYSLKNEADKAFEALDKAVELGFNDVNQFEGDSDFENVRKDKRYAELIEKLKGNN